MARRYFNVLKNHVVVLITLIILIAVSELADGTIATMAKIATGIVMIYVVFTYAIWLLKAPTAKMNEENS